MSYSGKDSPDLSCPLNGAGAEEAGTEKMLVFQPLAEGTGDSSLAGTCHSAQPVYRGRAGIACPLHQIVEDLLASAFGAVTTKGGRMFVVLGIFSWLQSVQN